MIVSSVLVFMRDLQYFCFDPWLRGLSGFTWHSARLYHFKCVITWQIKSNLKLHGCDVLSVPCTLSLSVRIYARTRLGILCRDLDLLLHIITEFWGHAQLLQIKHCATPWSSSGRQYSNEKHYAAMKWRSHGEVLWSPDIACNYKYIPRTGLRPGGKTHMVVLSRRGANAVFL